MRTRLRSKCLYHWRLAALTGVVKMIGDALPSPPPLSRSTGEGRFVVQTIVNHLHEDQ